MPDAIQPGSCRAAGNRVEQAQCAMKHAFSGTSWRTWLRGAGWSLRGTPAPLHLAAVLATLAVATVILVSVHEHLDATSVGLIYLLLTFGVSLWAGTRAAAIAAIVSFVTLNYFFIAPYHTFTISRRDHVLALMIYLIVAITTSQLVARVHKRTSDSIREQRRTTLLYELNAALIGDVTLDAILTTITERVVRVYGVARCRILRPDDEGVLQVTSRFPASLPGSVDRQHAAVATWVMDHREPAGQIRHSRIRPPRGVSSVSPMPAMPGDVDLLFVPIASARQSYGVLEVGDKAGQRRFDDDDRILLTSFANQAALALDRASMAEEAVRIDALNRSDELKSTLLAAVSHELRSPLAAIKASISSLRDPAVAWSDESRSEFLQAIEEETDRLTLMVGNLLDLSRIEGGALQPDRQWYDIAELLLDIEQRYAHRTSRHPIRLDLAENLPLVQFDYIEIAQVVTNLVNNAMQYTPEPMPIEISVRLGAGAIIVSVRDHGPGIPPHRVARIFEKFYRAEHTGSVAGSGIGLTISKGLVEAHGGRMWAESRLGEGTTVSFSLPTGGERDDSGAGR